MGVFKPELYYIVLLFNQCLGSPTMCQEVSYVPLILTRMLRSGCIVPICLRQRR